MAGVYQKIGWDARSRIHLTQIFLCNIGQNSYAGRLKDDAERQIVSGSGA
jgi:hypothetical protein